MSALVERTEDTRVRELAASRLGRPLSAAESHMDIIGIDIDLEMGKEQLVAAIETEKLRAINAAVLGRMAFVEVTDEMVDVLIELRDAGKRHAHAEMRSMGLIGEDTFAVTRRIPRSLEPLVATLGLHLNGISRRIENELAHQDISGVAQREIVTGIARRVPGAADAASRLVSGAMTTGLGDIYALNAHLFQQWEYSAIMDGATCAVCRHYDGMRFDTVEELYRVLPNFGPNPSCYGNGRCRCRGVPVPPNGRNVIDETLIQKPRTPVSELTHEELKQELKRMGWAINKAKSEHRLGRITEAERDRRLAELTARKAEVEAALKGTVTPPPPVVTPPPPVVTPPPPVVTPPPPVVTPPGARAVPFRPDTHTIEPVFTKNLAPNDLVAVEHVRGEWKLVNHQRMKPDGAAGRVIAREGDNWRIADPDGGEFLAPVSRARAVRVVPRGDVPTTPGPAPPVPAPSTLASKAAKLREERLGLDDDLLANAGRISFDSTFEMLPPQLVEAEATIRAIGHEVAMEITKRTKLPSLAERQKRVDRAQYEWDKARRALTDYEAEIYDKYSMQLYGQRFSDISYGTSHYERVRLMVRRDRKYKTLLKKEDEARRVMGAANRAGGDADLAVARREAVKEVLGEIRPMGGKLEGEIGRGVAADTQKAVDFYPADWVRDSNTYDRVLNIPAAKIRRGHYSHTTWVKGAPRRQIRLSSHMMGKTSGIDSDVFETLVHELGHVFQYSVGPRVSVTGTGTVGAGITAMRQRQIIALLENAWRIRRTTKNGIREGQVAMSYSRRERTRKDEYVNEYIGREYGRGQGLYETTEVLTMGMEGLTTDAYNMWERDPDMRDFILGLLAIV